MKMIITGILVTAIALLTISSGAQSPPAITGKTLYGKNCERCHGSNGTKGMFGAKNLQTSKLTDDAILAIIASGRRFMPSWKKKLTTEQMSLVKEYIKQLRI
jgi:cytochrome c6